MTKFRIKKNCTEKINEQTRKKNGGKGDKKLAKNGENVGKIPRKIYEEKKSLKIKEKK